MKKNPHSEFKRNFVPISADLGDWAAIEPLLQNLLDRPLDSAAILEQWLLDQSELMACLSEERARRYIAMTCHTEDEELEKKYLEFIEQIEPRFKPYGHRLNEKYIGCLYRGELDR